MAGTHWANILGSVGGLAAAAGLGLTAKTFASGNRIRRAELANQAISEYRSPGMRANVEKAQAFRKQFDSDEEFSRACLRYVTAHDPALEAVYPMLNYFETLAIGVSNKILDPHSLDLAIGGSIIGACRMFKPLISALQRSQPDAYVELERLASRMSS